MTPRRLGGGVGREGEGGIRGQCAPSLPAVFPLFCTGIPVPPLTPLAPLLSGLPIHRLRSLSESNGDSAIIHYPN